MLDFKRIGGEIISSPLNENFRQLRNEISIANSNLVFSETDGVKETLADMWAIVNPDNAQVCYVVSSGELYRYAAHDKSWYKIADFGHTFRQGFLNSGAVVLEDYIKLKEGTTATLQFPRMLLYYKNQDGDEKYLRGMYVINAQEVDISKSIAKSGAYSLLIESTGKILTEKGLPKTDNPNRIYLGTVIVNANKEINEDFIYTLPDIAYTADRGNFLLNGGQASGMNLSSIKDGESTKPIRNAGYYYDEGINFASGPIENFPVNVDNGSNYDLRAFGAENPAENFTYMTPTGVIDEEVKETLTGNKYWNGMELVDVPAGCFTIQQHLITPTGQNIIVYGEQYYNTKTDALSNINSTFGLTIEFPCVEATRIILGNFDEFNANDSSMCEFHTLSRLAQVGTFTPKFSDEAFELYSGDSDDIAPARVQFRLNELQKEEFDNYYYLTVLPYITERKLFALDKKFINGGETDVDMVVSESGNRSYNGQDGYQLADQVDLDYLANRVSDIETEIWALAKENVEKYEQSIRYRLTNVEDTIVQYDDRIAEQAQAIADVDDKKVDKTTTINGEQLTDNIQLNTDHIGEDEDATNLWFTDERVTNSPSVKDATTHINTQSNINDGREEHAQVNPHKLTTDDLYILSDSKKVFVTPEQSEWIANLPQDTKGEIEELDESKLESVKIELLDGDTISTLGNVTGIRLNTFGIDYKLTDDDTVVEIECKGQTDESIVMQKNVYALGEASGEGAFGFIDDDGKDDTPVIPVPYVDRAAEAKTAKQLSQLEQQGPGRYYGTNYYTEEPTGDASDIEPVLGWNTLPTYVTTKPKGEVTIDKIFWPPQDETVAMRHLTPELQDIVENNYYTIVSDGEVLSDKINTLRFGDGIDVNVVEDEPNVVQINSIADGATPVSKFVNLSDVNITYSKENEGKILVINDEGNGIVTSSLPSLDSFMIKGVYTVDGNPNVIKHAALADVASRIELAENSKAVNGASLNDDGSSSTTLWSAAKIMANTTAQIQGEGVNTYSGVEAPLDSLGKDGDIYILID